MSAILTAMVHRRLGLALLVTGALVALVLGLWPRVASRRLATTVTVSVRDRGAPVSGATVTLMVGRGEEVPRSAATGVDGRAVIELEESRDGLQAGAVPTAPVTVEVLVLGEERVRWAARDLELARGGNQLDLDLSRDFRSGPVVRASDPPARLTVAGVPPRLAYDLPELEDDRRVEAILEIDWIGGTALPTLAVETSQGTATIEDVFTEVGVELRVVWSDQIPAELLGTDPWPGEAWLLRIMAAHRSLSVGADQWHLHLLLAPQNQPGRDLSLLVDESRRTSAVVLLPPRSPHPGLALHAVIHELGHLLNLPHPWEVGANTRSVMSYPWRWPDWSWDDPAVYRFDAFGKHHVLRGPARYVRPGGSAFLDYGLAAPPESGELAADAEGLADH